MANQLLTISMITYEALRVLENDLTFTKHVRRNFDSKYGEEGAKIGTVLNIRKPPRYLGRVGQALQLEDATETSVPLTLTTQRGVDIAFSSQDLKLSVDDFRERFIEPAIVNVANNVDNDGLQQYLNIFNEVGTPGTIPNALLTYLNAGVALDNESVPRDKTRTLCISPAMQAVIVDTLKGLFHESTEIERQYEEGTMGRTIGFKWCMDQNVPTQTVGTYSGSPTVNGANQTGSSIITQSWPNTTAILNQGDIITFAGVFGVNSQTRRSTGQLRQFVVTANVVSSGAGAATIPIACVGGLGIIVAGPFQTVSGSPANGAAIVVQGASTTSSPRGLAYHKDCFAVASADLPLPGGVDMAARANDDQLGFSIRLIRAYDINTDRWPCRLDILYGWTTLYPELGCRIAS